MNILLLCNRVPYPANDGGSIAIMNIANTLLKKGETVKMLAMNTSKHYVNTDKLPSYFKENFKLETVDIDNTIKIKDALFCLIKGKSYHIERFISKEFSNKLQEVLRNETFDIIQLESLYLTPYIESIKSVSKTKIILRAHNIEYKIWERLAETSTSFLKKWYLRILSGQLKKFEIAHINSYDGIVSITQEDKDMILHDGCQIPVHVTPVGIHPEEYKLDIRALPENEFIVFHLGSMDWMPNQEGVLWFLENVWYKIIGKYPKIKLKLAGKNMPDFIKNKESERLIVQDYVEDAKEFIQSGHLMIVPLLSGGGMRVKIIEGMALGKAILTTEIGAEGIEYTKNKNILISNTPEEFINTITEYIDKPEEIKKIGAEARKLVETKYNNSIITEELIGFYQNLRSNKK